MRKKYIIPSILTVAMILIPLCSVERNTTVTVNAEAEENETNIVSVMLSENGKIENVDEREYVIGALTAEMDISCHEEALKAQALACRTYMLYRRENADSESFNGADVSDNPSECQGYLDVDARKEKWGNKFEENEKKAEKAVDAVLDKKIVYDGKPILAVYHNINCGKTLSAKAVWDSNIPYLQSVESPADKLSPDYAKTVVFSLSEFMNCSIKIDGVKLDDDYTKWIGKITADENGIVKNIVVGGKNLTGEEFREYFGLNSACFTVTAENEKLTIKTLGNGHMVGMSQYGADYMAQHGSTYEEILLHYYKNTEIV